MKKKNEKTVSVSAEVAETSDFKRLMELQADHSNASNRMENLQSEVNANYLELMEGALDDFAEQQEKIAATEEEMEILARQHPEWFDKKKSVKTPFGVVKFHRSSKLSVPNKELTIVLIDVARKEEQRRAVLDLTWIETLGGLIKTERVLDIEALEKLPDEALAIFRVTRESQDNFSAQPAKVELGKAVKNAEPATAAYDTEHLPA